jgi:hypothetical protein
MITMRPTAGEFLINGVRVGTWHETAKGVVHANTITGVSGQHPSYGDALTAVTESVTTWLSAISGAKRQGDQP